MSLVKRYWSILNFGGEKYMKITKVKKNSAGDIIEVMTDNGKKYSIEQAIKMAKNNEIEGVNVGAARDGSETLRSNRNESGSDNLANLPEFE